MALPPGLRLRGRVYYYRFRVPKDLVERMGRVDKWISLRTGDRTLALQRYWEEAPKWQQIFAEHRRRRDLTISGVETGTATRAFTPDEARALARSLVAEHLPVLDAQTTKYEHTPEEAFEIAAELDGRLVDLQAKNENGQLDVFQSATTLLRKHGYDYSSIDPVLWSYVQRALIVLARRERARFDGDFSDSQMDADFREVGAADLTFLPANPQLMTLKDAADRFWREQAVAGVTSSKTERKYRAALDHLVAFFGPDIPISEITRKQCLDFRDLVADLPSNFTKRFGRERGLREIAEEAKRQDLPSMAYETQANYLNVMVRLFSWARDENLLDEDIGRKLKPLAKKTRNEEKRGSFGAAELKAIFKAPIYTGCVNDERGFSRPGPNIIRRSRYWVPLIGLFTGMRLGEILQLTVDHVRQSENGTNFLFVGDMELKTPNSLREVPIHSQLVEIGFLEFVQDLRRSKKSRLFDLDDVPIASDGTRSSVFSKRFAHFLRTVGLKEASSGSCFHMFRHTFRDALRRGNVPEEHAEAICGWSRGSRTSRSYGEGFEADTLAPWLEKMALPKIDLSHIIYHPNRARQRQKEPATVRDRDL